MTGPEHYREAELLLAEAQATATHAVKKATNGEAFDAEEASRLAQGAFAAAQVHATLALASATAHPGATVRDRP